jgi:hypothetical protein
MAMEKTPPNARGYCSVANFLTSKDEEFRKEFEELLANDSASTASLHRFLWSNDNTFPKLTTFKSHRNKWCSCGSKG